MEPNQTQAGGQTSAPSSPNLDPSVVALTKAIGKAESGGDYKAGDNTGDGASSSGAYQFTPDFLQEWAPKAGIQYQKGMNLSPAQQDQIAYNAIKTMGTTGDPAYPQLGKLSPAQITSAWNTGDPNAYLDPDYGKNNSYGSTENYVNKVGEYYNEFSGQSLNQQNTSANANQPTSQNNSGQPGWLQALEGLGIGAIGWLGGELVNPVKDAAANAVTGAVAGEAIDPAGGGIPGAVAGGLGGVVEGIGQDIFGGGNNNQNPPKTSNAGSDDQNQNNQSEPQLDQTIPQSAIASNLVQDAIKESLGSTQSNRVFSQSQAGQDAIRTAAIYGLINPDEQGNLSFNEEKQKEALQSLAQGEKAYVSSEGGNGQMASVLNYAAQYLGRNKNMTPTQRQEALQKVRKEASGYAPSNGNMPLERMVEGRHQQYKATKGKYGELSTSQIEAHKALAHGFRQTVRNGVKEPEFYDRVLKEESNLINARNVGKRLNGKKAPKKNGIWESFLRQGARAAEIYIGDKLGGPLGAIIGGLAGEAFNRKIDKKFGRNIFETKGMKAALDVLRDTKPKEYTMLIDALKKHGIQVKDENKKPSSEEGLVQLVKKDEKKMGKKGLISVKSYKGQKPQS